MGHGWAPCRETTQQKGAEQTPGKPARTAKRACWEKQIKKHKNEKTNRSGWHPLNTVQAPSQTKDALETHEFVWTTLKSIQVSSLLFRTPPPPRSHPRRSSPHNHTCLFLSLGCHVSSQTPPPSPEPSLQPQSPPTATPRSPRRG